MVATTAVVVQWWFGGEGGGNGGGLGGGEDGRKDGSAGMLEVHHQALGPAPARGRLRAGRTRAHIVASLWPHLGTLQLP